MFQAIVKKQEIRRFNYKARYYEQGKADIRKQKILNGEEDTHVNFGDRFHQKISESRKVKRNSMKNLAVMLAILALLLYVVVKLSHIAS